MIIGDFHFSNTKTFLNFQKEINTLLNDLQTYNPEQKGKNPFAKLETLLENKNYQNILKNPKNLQKFLQIKELVDKNAAAFPKNDQILNLQKRIDSIIYKSEAQEMIPKSVYDKIENTKKIVNLAKSLTLANDSSKEIDSLKPFIKKLSDILTNIKTNAKPLTTYNKFQDEIDKNISSIKDVIASISSKLKSYPQDIQKIANRLISILDTNGYKTEQTPLRFDQIVKETIKSFKNLKISLPSGSKTIQYIGNITKNLNKIVDLLQNEPKLQNQKAAIENFTKTIEKIDIQKNIQNSGVAYESKVAKQTVEQNMPDKILQNDIKGVLLDLKNHKDLPLNSKTSTLIDNTLSQIQAYQANSLLGATFISYIPFLWDDLKEGSMKFDKSKKGDSFSCKIELSLEKHGDINVLLLLNSNTISVGIDIEDKELRKKIEENLPLLKEGLRSISLSPNIFFTDKKEDPFKKNSIKDSVNLGMDIKI